MSTVIKLDPALRRRERKTTGADPRPSGHGTVIDLIAAMWRRIATLELSIAEARQATSRRASGSCSVIAFSSARWRRIEALELEVAEWHRLVAQTPRNSWQRMVYTSELIEAERRLSIAEGMRRNERLDDDALKESRQAGPALPERDAWSRPFPLRSVSHPSMCASE